MSFVKFYLIVAKGSKKGLPIPIDAGEHTIVAKAPGYLAWRAVVRIKREATGLCSLVVVEDFSCHLRGNLLTSAPLGQCVVPLQCLVGDSLEPTFLEPRIHFIRAILEFPRICERGPPVVCPSG
jgi:hypothetical protein